MAWAASDFKVTTKAIPDANVAFTVALTGGIASGKTSVSDEFARLGVTIIDTDLIAREIVEPGRPALREIEDQFGKDLINGKGQLDREAMRSIIFSDPGARKRLESILHPRIRKEVTKAIRAVTSAYCILVVPLLVESGAYPDVDRTLVVDVDRETQISRLMARDKCEREHAIRILAAQASRAERLEIADDILENSGTFEQLREKVEQLDLKYSKLARNH